jgi:hypothetical protein
MERDIEGGGRFSFEDQVMAESSGRWMITIKYII